MIKQTQGKDIFKSLKNLEEFCTPQTRGEILQRKSWGGFLLKIMIRKSGKLGLDNKMETSQEKSRKIFLSKECIVDLHTRGWFSSFVLQVFNLKYELFWIKIILIKVWQEHFYTMCSVNFGSSSFVLTSPALTLVIHIIWANI